MTGWSLGMARTSPVIREYILRPGCNAVKLEARALEGPPSALERPVPNTRQPRKIRYTAAEWGRIMEPARASGRPPARYVREASLGAAPRVRRSQANEDVIRELGRIGTALLTSAGGGPVWWISGRWNGHFTNGDWRQNVGDGSQNKSLDKR